jgi:hypothetical protein
MDNPTHGGAPFIFGFGVIVKQEYLLGCYPERSSLLIGAVFCLIVGLSLVLVIISPGW